MMFRLSRVRFAVGLAIILGGALICAVLFSPAFFKSSVAVETFEGRLNRLLVVFAHTDDEVTNSALIRHFSNLGTSVTLLTLTDGAANPQSNLKACVSGETITECRLRELSLSAKLMGVQRIETPRLPDSLLMENLDKAAQVVLDELNRFQPEAILTMEPSGLNGLADHRAAFLSVAKAIPKSPHKPRLILSTLPWPISFVLPSKIPSGLRHQLRIFPVDEPLHQMKVAVAEVHKSQSATIQGLTLGLGPERLFRWLDFETYSLHNVDDLHILNQQ